MHDWGTNPRVTGVCAVEHLRAQYEIKQSDGGICENMCAVADPYERSVVT